MELKQRIKNKVAYEKLQRRRRSFHRRFIFKSLYSRFLEFFCKKKYNCKFDTSIKTENLGDCIIMHYCNQVFAEIFCDFSLKSIPTHMFPVKKEKKILIHSKNKIVCGTNLISPAYERYTNWKIPNSILGYTNIITLGVGWGEYSEQISPYSKTVYNCIFSKKGIHSVRDSYTEKKFKEMGIYNVVNTGCPTLWNLTEAFCEKIPKQKAKNVVTTIVDYDRKPENDREFINILLKNYENVYVWLQGSKDYEYLKQLIDVNKVVVLEHSLFAFNEILQSPDIEYVGLRLHAGIYALNNSIYSIIIALDNRAKEMGRDFNLPIVYRENIGIELEYKILEHNPIQVKMPIENINLWKQQFHV